MFEVEVVEAEFEINQRALVKLARIKKINKLTTDLLVKTVVGKIQAQQCGVACKSLNHFLDATVLLCIVRQVV